MSERYKQALEDMVWQFACRANDDSRKWLSTGGLSALENAFDALGWEDPHYVDEAGCEEPGCAKWSTCGTPTPEGYKLLCSEHGMKHLRRA